jgi:hypothetical protein
MTEAVREKLDEMGFGPPALPAEIKQGAPGVPGNGQVPRPLHYPSSIAKAIIAVSREIGQVSKDGVNKFQNYKYQAWDDIIRALQPAMINAGLIVTQSEVGRSIEEKIVTVTYEFTLVHESGDVWPDRLAKTGMARLIDSKGVFDDKALNKCSTQAHKYWAIAIFKIATPDTVDSDGDELVKGPAKTFDDRQVNEEPHAIVVKGSGTRGWAQVYQAAIRRAPTAEICDRWYLENKANLVSLSKADRPAWQACEDAFKRRKEELKAAPANKPLPPRVDQVDPDTGEIEPLDEKQWLNDLEGALVGVEDMDGLKEIKDKVMLPAQSQVSSDAWKLGVRLYQARVSHVAGSDILSAG